MKYINYLFLLLAIVVASCQKTHVNRTEKAVVIQNTCGGTVIDFISSDFGEEWNNFFEDSAFYLNAAITENLIEKGFQKGDTISFSYEEVLQLNGKFCDIGGLPETKVILTSLKISN